MVYFQQLDLTLQDSGADETCASNVSSAQLSMEDGGKDKKAIRQIFKQNMAGNVHGKLLLSYFRGHFFSSFCAL